MKKGILSTLFILSFACFCMAQTSETVFIKDDRTNTSSTQPPSRDVYIDNWRTRYDRDSPHESRRNIYNDQTEEQNRDSKIINRNGNNYTVNTNARDSFNSLNKAPYGFAAMLNRAVTEFSNKKYRACLSVCDDLIALYPSFSEPYFLKGAAFYGIKDQENALKYFKIAAEKGSKDSQAALEQFK